MGYVSTVSRKRTTPAPISLQPPLKRKKTIGYFNTVQTTLQINTLSTAKMHSFYIFSVYSLLCITQSLASQHCQGAKFELAITRLANIKRPQSVWQEKDG